MKLVDLNSQQLDDFVATHGGDFLQSWEWSEFNAKLGSKVWRLGVEEKGELIATAILIKKMLPFGLSYWYCPRGPIINFEFRISNFEKIFNFLMTESEKLAKKEKIVFFRFEPTQEFSIQNSKFKIKNSVDIQPSKTIILNLDKSEDELLGAMHPKTRYNIKLAGKKNLSVKHGRPNESEFAEFWRLMEVTKQRDKFSLHGRAYYQTMLSSPLMELWQVFFEEHLLAAAVVAKFGDTVTYVHGASADAWRPLMAPYWLHWQIIKQAKAEGYKYYDLFGVDKAKWPGVTRFKEGWGGRQTAYPGTFDFVFNSLYYRIYQLARRMRRRL
jgi:lipid II:glycine glycyltransferase (peptidoglycan interpeptide bridge formation enzyme)